MVRRFYSVAASYSSSFSDSRSRHLRLRLFRMCLNRSIIYLDWFRPCIYFVIELSPSFKVATRSIYSSKLLLADSLSNLSMTVRILPKAALLLIVASMVVVFSNRSNERLLYCFDCCCCWLVATLILKPCTGKSGRRPLPLLSVSFLTKLELL